MARSTCSWSKVTTSHRVGQRPQVGLDQRRARAALRTATAQAASSGLSASTATESPRALAASAAIRASWPAPTTPTWWALRSLASAKIGGSGHDRHTRRGALSTMAKPLRIGSLIDVDRSLPDTVAELRRFADAGLDHAFAVQIFGPDALTLLAAAGAQVPGIGLGTGVVPVYPRHPMMLAQQALTVQWATGEPPILGIGLSHQVVVEGMWGLSFDKPARYMKEYLAALMPLLARRDGQRGRRARHHQHLRARSRCRGATAPRCWWPRWATPCSSWPGAWPTAPSPG